MGGQLGLGYVYFLSNAQKYSDSIQWFPMIEPELNVYYSTYRNDGDVQRFLNNIAYSAEFDYDMLIHSTRLMFDVALTVASWRQFSTYIIGGIGNAWNDVDYSDADTTCNQNLSLDGDRSSFVWEVGAGVAYNIIDRASLTFEYLYTDFGQLKTSDDGNNGVTGFQMASPASFNLQTQALLLGLHVKL